MLVKKNTLLLSSLFSFLILGVQISNSSAQTSEDSTGSGDDQNIISRSFTGSLTNTSFDIPGTITIDFYKFPNRRRGRVTGFVDIDGPPADALCGGGEFKGRKRGRKLTLRFTSADPDPECGFDAGLKFRLTGRVRKAKDESGAVIGTRYKGKYRIVGGQEGNFDGVDLSATSK